ncbi:MAG: hypothetical protein FWF84_05065, partial [Kiritimatiellaeota bacterium]|nr:hypothetical protein [Kiritimatiellota bacterium]
MRVAIHNGDGTGARFPNLALMKLSAWHKALGDSVEWFNALDRYDRVYSSKVFTFTPRDPYLPPDAILGGTGYGVFNELPSEVEACEPDYTLYPDFPHALGFITRGCVRECPWCVVPRKEGAIRFDRHALTGIIRMRKSAVFMDNNFLAYKGRFSELCGIQMSGA